MTDDINKGEVIVEGVDGYWVKRKGGENGY